LAAAGGIAPYALQDSLVLIRYFKNAGRKALELENNPENQEMAIQDRDIIVVKSSTWGKIVHGTGINIGIPGLGIGYHDPDGTGINIGIPGLGIGYHDPERGYW